LAKVSIAVAGCVGIGVGNLRRKRRPDNLH
jgi:hypothetical protein